MTEETNVLDLLPATMARSMTVLTQDRAKADIIHNMQELCRFGSPVARALGVALDHVRKATATADGDFSVAVPVHEMFFWKNIDQRIETVEAKASLEASLSSTIDGFQVVVDTLRHSGTASG